MVRQKYLTCTSYVHCLSCLEWGCFRKGCWEECLNRREMNWQTAVENVAMRGLIIYAVCYYVETPLPVGNANIIRSIFNDKYAGKQISTVVTLVASSECTYLFRGSPLLICLSGTWCDLVFLCLFHLSFFKNFASHWPLLNCYICKRSFKRAVGNKYILHPILFVCW